VEYRHLTAAEANARILEFKAVYAAVFSQPPYNEGPEMHDRLIEWVRDESGQPGFDFVEAIDDGRVVGFAYGHARPAGEWWRGADQPAPAEVKLGPTFAVMEWAVLPEHRGQGIGRVLMDELLAGRTEPFAVLTVNPATTARTIYERWGWQRVAGTKPGSPSAMDIMLLKLT
jgi:GNAT superfamily N-acetyltransferase